MKTVLFGAGEMTLMFFEREDYIQYDILAVADNDKKKCGLKIGNRDRCVAVISPEEIMSYDFDVIVVTVADYGCKLDIIEQLLNLGVLYQKIKFLRNWKLVDGVRLSREECYYPPKGTLLFDCTQITQIDFKTGIQRVVRELFRNMLMLGMDICPVQYVSGNWITSREFYCRMMDEMFDNIEYSIVGEDNEIFLSDASRGGEGFVESLGRYKKSVYIIYDLIPVLYLDVFPDLYRKQFKKWVNNALNTASKLICISKSVADDIVKYYRQNDFYRDELLGVYFVHLGKDICMTHGNVRKEIKDFVSRAMTFLIVGTVEPRKNHLLLLESLKKVIKKVTGYKLQLLILGRDGWMNDEFKHTYTCDECLKGRVLWIKDSSDSEVQWAYRYCSALIYPSRAEGFGLPLVEASHFGLPVLCSDIPVFREIAGDNVDYFTVDDENSLCESLINWLKVDSHPDSRKIRTYTWQETAKEIMDILNNKIEPYVVLK